MAETTASTGSKPTTKANGASGSGCTPSGDTLGNGKWYGFVSAATSTAIDFDLACWYTGAAANAAAAADGEESPPPNDYYVRNESTRTRSVKVAPTATVAWLPQPGNPAAEDVSYADWLADREARDFQPSAWLTIEGGQITHIEEQYTP
jgi:hypothetical protein